MQFDQESTAKGKNFLNLRSSAAMKFGWNRSGNRRRAESTEKQRNLVISIAILVKLMLLGGLLTQIKEIKPAG